MDEDPSVYVLPPSGTPALSKLLYMDYIFYLVADLMPGWWRNRFFRKRMMHLGENCIITNGAWMTPLSRISIGDDVWIGWGTRIFAHRDGAVEIGDHVLVGPEVVITAVNHDMSKLSLSTIGKPIKIKSHVWLGAHSVILPGVTVGEGAVVAAGAVVARDVPDWTVVGGVPAREIKKREIT